MTRRQPECIATRSALWASTAAGVCDGTWNTEPGMLTTFPEPT